MDHFARLEITAPVYAWHFVDPFEWLASSGLDYDSFRSLSVYQEKRGRLEQALEAPPRRDGPMREDVEIEP